MVSLKMVTVFAVKTLAGVFSLFGWFFVFEYFFPLILLEEPPVTILFPSLFSSRISMATQEKPQHSLLKGEWAEAALFI